MAELAEAFEQHLRSLSDAEWDALTQRVRTPKTPPTPPQLPNEHRDEPNQKFSNPGMQEAYRRGFVDADGKPVTR